MANTPEGRVKDGVKKLLNQHGCYYHMPVVAGYGKRTLDFIGCHRGRFFAIETKAGNKDMTEQQEATSAEMVRAGAEVFLVNDSTGTASLAAWLSGVYV